ncbi:hypothetical protein F2Q69_00023912 [Brassica cretica]|uniref:Uncharacterized protein n=1 Tax=Brassica cretica TaxID=69181 RepID=A0A8S9Q5A6_BRACR|nr:hypothetical protein F2Q69_00023912 [Brassica cretica]
MDSANPPGNLNPPEVGSANLRDVISDSMDGKEQNLEGSKEVLQGEAKGEQTVTNGSQEECRVSNWKTVSPEKVGRSSPGHVSEVLISASKFSVLTVDEKEEVEEE